MKISNIFFDLGNTLFAFDFNIAFHRVAKQSSLELEELMGKTFEAQQLIDSYELGEISTESFFDQIRDLLCYQDSTETLIEIWQDIFTPMEGHIFLFRALAQYYPTAAISNTSDAHISFLEKHHSELFELFHHKIYSFQEGVMKPDHRIYHLALDRMGGDKYEALLIDDREDNILAAAKLGWQTIHLRPEVSLKDALRSYDLQGV